MNSTTGGGHRLNGPRIFACSTASIAAIATEPSRAPHGAPAQHEPALDTAHGAAGADAGWRGRPARPARHQGRPRVFAIMLGGVRSPQQTAEELADDVIGLGRQWLRHLGDPRAAATSSASPDWSIGRTAAASLYASPYGRKPRDAALPAKPPAPRCASVTSRLGLPHHRRGPRNQFRLAHGARWHWHDRVRQLHPVRLSHGDIRKRCLMGAVPSQPACNTRYVCKNCPPRGAPSHHQRRPPSWWERHCPGHRDLRRAELMVATTADGSARQRDDGHTASFWRNK